MKISRFNSFANTDDGEVLAFNAYTHALVKLSRDTYRIYEKALTDDGHMVYDESDPLVSAIIADLKKGGFLVDDNVNELDLLKYNHTRERYSVGGHVGLTIGVTTACNFKCTYCYEKIDKPDFMSREVEDKIIDFVNRMQHKKSMSVTWYGGEPLLAFDTICRLSDAFMKITAEKGMFYSAFIVTNGYLLDREKATELAKRKVRSAQVTLDGCPEVHDKRRMLKNGDGTFDRIMKNIVDVIDILNIDIRCNLDKTNRDLFPKLLDEIERYGIADKLEVLAPSVLEAFEFSPQEIKDNVYTPEEFLDVNYQTLNMLMDRGIRTALTPTSGHRHCTSGATHSFVIDSHGNLYKCWDTIGMQNEVAGTVENGVDYNDNFLKWVTWSCFDNEKCRNCSLLPICLGGCARMYVVKDEVLNKCDRCSPYKYDMKKYLELMYRYGRIMKKLGRAN